MLLSTQTDVVFHRCGATAGLQIFKEAGYDAIDYSMFGMTRDDHFLITGDAIAYAKQLRADADAIGLHFNQAHAPFPCWKNGDEAYNAKMPARIETAIRIAGILGADSIVVHPIAYVCGNAAEQKEVNMKLYHSLAPIAKEYGTKVALENMWGRDSRRNYIVSNVCSTAADLCDYFDALDDDEAFTVCLDLGHSGLVGEEAQDAIRILGHDRLGALHVHDNNYIADSHLVPYDSNGRMNWEKICTALGEIDYKGDFTFEADNFLTRLDTALLPNGVCYMAALGRMLMARIDAARPAK